MGAAAAIAGVAALGSAGIGFAGANKSSKAAKGAASAAKDSAKALERIRDQLRSGSLFGKATEDFTGSRPEFAPFQRLNIGEAVGSSAADQLGALPDVATLTLGVNDVNQLSNAVRFERLFPGGLDALKAQGQAAASLSRGELPFDDALEVVRDRAGLANSLGLGGTQFAAATPRDLGLSRLQAIQQGSALTAQGAATANQINPLSSQLTAQQNLISAPQAVDLELRQNLLEQQSLQAFNNLQAAPDPAAQGLLNLELQRLQLRSSGQLAAAGIESSNALATAQQQQQSLANISSLFQPTGLGASQASPFNSALTGLTNLFTGSNSVPYNPRTQVVPATPI